MSTTFPAEAEWNLGFTNHASVSYCGCFGLSTTLYTYAISIFFPGATCPCLSAAFTEVAAAAAMTVGLRRFGRVNLVAIDCVCSERRWLFDSIARLSARVSDL